jgi:hypothetical protein
MKLFITNKNNFEHAFNYNLELTKKIHIDAFNELKNSIDINNSIPLLLTPSFDDLGLCLFDFINKKGDVYFYEFSTTIK